VLELATDASEYFDWHHTSNDTFDKIDIKLLRENIAGYAAMARLAADREGEFGRLLFLQGAAALKPRHP
jgi:hypothetical protein